VTPNLDVQKLARLASPIKTRPILDTSVDISSSSWWRELHVGRATKVLLESSAKKVESDKP